MKPIHINDIEVFRPELNARKVFSMPQVDVISIELQAGQSMPMHINEQNMHFIVLEGQGNLETENQTFDLQTHCTIRVPKGITRAWHNRSQSVLKLLAIKQFE